jgi:hypothetical protein
MQTNPMIRSKSFNSFLSFVLLMGFVWLVNWAGGFRDFLRKARINEPRMRNPDGTSSATPQLVLLPGGKA